jgi:hypothetical protein
MSIITPINPIEWNPTITPTEQPYEDDEDEE